MYMYVTTEYRIVIHLIRMPWCDMLNNYYTVITCTVLSAPPPSSEMGLEEEPPPLPARNYSWSDMEDNDDELFQSDDDLDDTSGPVSISDHQKIYSSVCWCTHSLGKNLS